MPPDDMTIGELGRRFDEMRGDVRELATYMREHVEKLPASYVPRAELEARNTAADLRVAVHDDEIKQLKADHVSGLRQTVMALGAALAAAIPGLIAITHHS